MSKVAKIPTQLCNEGDNKLCESELSWLRLEHWALLVQTEATQRRLPGGGDYDREGEGIVGNIVLLIIKKSGCFLDNDDDTVNDVLGDDEFENDI